MNLPVETLLPELKDINETPVLQSHDQTLIIHRAQYNIGRLAVLKWLQSGALNVNFTFKSINLLMIGPSYLDLKNQTEDDLNLFLQSIGINALPSPIVINSSSLQNKKDNFFDRIKNNQDELHVIVHDEAHWGIEEDSKINSFFEEVRRFRDDLRQQNIHRHIIILLVSATVNVITKVVDVEDEGNRIDWSQLRNNDVTYYGAPRYRSIYDLNYIVDGNIGDAENLETASTMVVDEYSNAARSIRNGGGGTGTHADRVLRDLCNPRPAMAVIRLYRQEDAKELVQCLKRELVHVQDKPIILQLDATTDTIQQQLVQQRYQGRLVTAVRQLDHINVIVVVVNKLSMGERIPSTCKYFDVRCRYLNKGINSFATFIQDIGRCAGHKPYSAEVLVGVDWRSRDKIKNWDRLIIGVHDARPRKGHPEYSGNGVYEALCDLMVILDAEPQIGKTGAILSALWVLQDTFIQGTTPHHRHDTLLQTLTRQWSELATNDLPQFLSTFKGDNWRQYHDIFAHAQMGWSIKPNEVICETLENLYNNAYYGDDQLTIADCGCGDSGIVTVMRRDPNDYAWRQTTIHGYDIDDRIQVLAQHNKTPVFVAHVENMCTTLLPNNAKYNVIVFCLSLFESDIRRHMDWCRNNLLDRGNVIIMETLSRFSTPQSVDQFKTAWTQIGFSCREKDKGMFKMFILNKNPSSGTLPRY